MPIVKHSKSECVTPCLRKRWSRKTPTHITDGCLWSSTRLQCYGCRYREIDNCSGATWLHFSSPWRGVCSDRESRHIRCETLSASDHRDVSSCFKCFHR